MFKNSVRTLELFEIVEKNPGIRFREVMRTTGIKNGSLSCLVKKLECSKKIKVERSPKQTRFFPSHLNNNQIVIIKALRGYTTRAILMILLEAQESGLSSKEINKHVRKARSTLSYFIRRLVDDQIITAEYDGMEKIFRLKDPITIRALTDLYHPGLLERATDGMEDIFNSL